MSIYRDQKAIQLTPELREYLLQVGVREPELLENLRAQTVNMPERNMQILPEQGQFLNLLVKIVNPKSILEIGTYTGYSSLCMALALPEVKITALDKNPEWTKVAKKYWQQAGVSDRINLILGQAIDNLPDIADSSQDLVFIDADKRSYILYYEQALRVTKPQGVIIVDNVLWNGRVIDDNHMDTGTKTIRELNVLIRKDDRVDISMVPIGDGLTIIRKR